MQTRPLGAGGPPVSTVGFGAMKLSIDGRPDEAEALRVLLGALEAGFTLIDTADVYSMDADDLGHNERLIARALAEWPDRDRVVVATKGGSSHPERNRWKPDGRPEHLAAACDASLRALGVERIDLYFLHAVDPEVPYAESLDAVAALVEAGKVRWAGVSNVGLAELELARARLPLRAVQNMLNPYCRDALEARWFRRSLLARCAKHGLAFLAHSPMGSWWSASLPEHPVVAPIATRLGVRPHAVALAWVLSRAPHVIALAGTRSLERVRELAEAAELELSPADQRAITAAAFPRT